MAKTRTDGDGSVYQLHTDACPAAVQVTGDDGKKRWERPKHPCKGKWQAVIVLGYRDGKPLRKKKTASTKSGAGAALRELQSQRDADELPAGKSLSVEQWMTYWFTKIAPRRCGDLTIAGYSTKVNHYIIPLLGHHKLDRLTPEHIEDAWDRLADTGNPVIDDPQPLSSSTIHQTHRILARALKVAVQRKRLRTNPAGSDSMDAPAKIEKEIVPIPRGDVDQLLAAAEGEVNEARWSCALGVGLRPGEALGLPWYDDRNPTIGGLDLDTGILRVRQTLKRVTGKGLIFGTPKSAAGNRDIVLPGELLERFRAHKKAQTEMRLKAGSAWVDSGLVFTMDDGRPIDPSVDSRRWRALELKAGVPHHRLYDARHSAATILLATGVGLRTAMDILGHSQQSMTLRYQHAVDELKVDAAAKIDAALWGQSS